MSVQRVDGSHPRVAPRPEDAGYPRASHRRSGGNALRGALRKALLAWALVSLAATGSPAQDPPSGPASNGPANGQPSNGAGPAAVDPALSGGFHVFQYLIENQGIRTTTDLRQVQQRPRQSVLVVMGDLEANQILNRLNLRDFVRRGGVVLLATDQTHWIDGVGIFKAGPVVVAPSDAYQQFDDCPRVRNLVQRHTLSRQVGELIANRAGWLDELFPDEGRWRTIAVLPTSARPVAAPGTLAAVLSSKYSQTGRVLALADHSVLINGMLVHGDNAQFAINVARWLSWDQRRQLAFVVDGMPLGPSGRPADPSQVNLPPLDPDDLPPIDWRDLRHLPADFWLPFGNQLLATMEDSQFHNELVRALTDPQSEWMFWRMLYVAGGLLAGWFFFRQFIKRGTHVPTPSIPDFPTRCESRTQKQLTTRQFRATVGTLAQTLFWQLTGSHESEDWYRLIRTVEVEGGWGAQRKLRRTLTELLEIAHDRDLRAIGRKRFRTWVQRIRAIQQLHQQGRIETPA